VALLVVFLVLLWYWYSPLMPRFWRTWALPLGLGGLAGALILGVALVEPLRDRVSSMFIGRGDSSNNFRINVWTAVVDMIRDRPILGIGPGNTAFNKVYPLYMKPRFTALSAYSGNCGGNRFYRFNVFPVADDCHRQSRFVADQKSAGFTI